MTEVTITVYTPTYNRGYCLSNCYESLKRQTSKDFKWMIIDDGSTDNTKELVDLWIKENVVKIEYYFKANGGMHTGHNEARKHLNTELNVCIDSDDYMTDNAIELIIEKWRLYGGIEYAGLAGLDIDKYGKVIGKAFPDGLKDFRYYELKPIYKIVGDKKSVFRTDVIKECEEYPVFDNEKFVPLYWPILIDQKYKTLSFNDALCVVEYQEDGSTLNIVKQYMRNPIGFIFYRRILMDNVPIFRVKFKNAIHYVSSCLLIRKFKLLFEYSHRGLILLAFPFGILLYLYLYKWRAK